MGGRSSPSRGQNVETTMVKRPLFISRRREYFPRKVGDAATSSTILFPRVKASSPKTAPRLQLEKSAMTIDSLRSSRTGRPEVGHRGPDVALVAARAKMFRMATVTPRAPSDFEKRGASAVEMKAPGFAAIGNALIRTGDTFGRRGIPPPDIGRASVGAGAMMPTTWWAPARVADQR